MAFVDMPNYVQVGKCYQLEDGTYLGKFIGTSAGDVYDQYASFASNYVRIVYDFENKKGVHEAYRVKEVPCRTGGKRRTRKHKRKHKKTQKRRR
jgi:hypothetical protein